MTMTSPNPDRDPDANMSDLIDALHAMRDELVKTSLSLRDYQFHFDSVQRRAAAEDAMELMEKVKQR